MIDEKSAPIPRRISPIRRALKPVQDRIGQLNEATAFLAASAQRQPDATALLAAISQKRQELDDTLSLFDAATTKLPEKYLGDSRLTDTRTSIDRLRLALDGIEGQLHSAAKSL